MKRTPGRPPIDDNDPSVPVHVKLSSKDYDAACEQSKEDRVSVPEVLRRAFRASIDKKTQNR